jgi:hypothetical protein
VYPQLVRLAKRDENGYRQQAARAAVERRARPDFAEAIAGDDLLQRPGEIGG